MIKTFHRQLADALGPEYLVYQAVSDFGFSTWYICKKGTLWGFIPWNSCLATIGSLEDGYKTYEISTGSVDVAKMLEDVVSQNGLDAKIILTLED